MFSAAHAHRSKTTLPNRLPSRNDKLETDLTIWCSSRIKRWRGFEMRTISIKPTLANSSTWTYHRRSHWLEIRTLEVVLEISVGYDSLDPPSLPAPSWLLGCRSPHTERVLFFHQSSTSSLRRIHSSTAGLVLWNRRLHSGPCFQRRELGVNTHTTGDGVARTGWLRRFPLVEA